MNAIERIAQVAQMTEGLALVIVTGPGTWAEEGLDQVGRALAPARTNTIWHRLDTQGADLASTINKRRGKQTLLVHGLQYMAAGQRDETLARLNMVRDTLAPLKACIVIWVPRELIGSFQQRCPDLFHWRSLMVSLDSVEQEPTADVQARREYQARLEQALAEHGIGSRVDGLIRKSGVDVPRMVLPEDGPPLMLESWVRDHRFTVLVDRPGSGRSHALRALARRYSERFAAGELDAPVPVLINGALPLRVEEAVNAALGEAGALRDRPLVLLVDDLARPRWDDSEYREAVSELAQWVVKRRACLVVTQLGPAVGVARNWPSIGLVTWTERDAAALWNACGTTAAIGSRLRAEMQNDLFRAIPMVRECFSFTPGVCAGMYQAWENLIVDEVHPIQILDGVFSQAAHNRPQMFARDILVDGGPFEQKSSLYQDAIGGRRPVLEDAADFWHAKRLTGRPMRNAPFETQFRRRRYSVLLLAAHDLTSAAQELERFFVESDGPSTSVAERLTAVLGIAAEARLPANFTLQWGIQAQEVLSSASPTSWPPAGITPRDLRAALEVAGFTLVNPEPA